MSDKRKRYILPEEEIPHYWYNIQAILSLQKSYADRN